MDVGPGAAAAVVNGGNGAAAAAPLAGGGGEGDATVVKADEKTAYHCMPPKDYRAGSRCRIKWVVTDGQGQVS